MTGIDFTEFLKRLCAYHERRIPSQQTTDEWWPKIKHIPSEALDFIRDRLCDNDTLPRNMPGAINALWNEWLVLNPHKRASENSGCKFCDGRGWLHAEREVDENGTTSTVSFVAPCGHCRKQPANEVAPYATVYTLHQTGATPPWPWLDFGKRRMDKEHEAYLREKWDKNLKLIPVGEVVDENASVRRDQYDEAAPW